jgi:hypothetical protein
MHFFRDGEAYPVICLTLAALDFVCNDLGILIAWISLHGLHFRKAGNAGYSRWNWQCGKGYPISFTYASDIAVGK